jgi:hypothetical protein
MRHLSSIIIFLLLIASCKKSEIPGPGSLVGLWMWAETWNDGAPGPKNPLTPQNADYGEQLFLNSDYTYYRRAFGATIETIPVTGSFSIGHGIYTPYKGAYIFDYDSIVFYKNRVYSDATVEYFKVSHDTLIFSTGFRGLSGGGSKTFVKQSD